MWARPRPGLSPGKTLAWRQDNREPVGDRAAPDPENPESQGLTGDAFDTE